MLVSSVLRTRQQSKQSAPADRCSVRHLDRMLGWHRHLQLQVLGSVSLQSNRNAAHSPVEPVDLRELEAASLLQDLLEHPCQTELGLR